MYSLLDGFVVTFVFRVVPQSDETELPENGGGCADDFIMTHDKQFRYWPKSRMYRLVISDDPENTFAPGIYPVGFAFWETTDYRDTWTASDCSPNKSKFWRTGLLAEVQGKNIDDFPLEPETKEIVRYTTAASFENRVRATIEEQSKVFENVLQSFARTGALSIQDTSALHLKCRIQIQDERPWPRSRLPVIEGKWCTPAPYRATGIAMPL